MCETLFLYEDTDVLISQCSTCRKVCVYFQQVMFSLEEDQFLDWHTSFFTSAFDQRAYLFPDHQFKVILDTPYSDVQLIFNKDQYKELKNGVEQALHFMSIKTMIEEGL